MKAKNIMAIAIATTMLALVGCGNKDNSSVADTTSTVETTTTATTEATTETTTEAITEVETTTTEATTEAIAVDENAVIVDHDGITLALPEGFEETVFDDATAENHNGSVSYKGSTEHNPEVNLIFSAWPNYDAESAKRIECTPENVANILGIDNSALKDRNCEEQIWTRVRRNLYPQRSIDDYKSISESNTDTEAFGQRFIVSRGVTHFKYLCQDDTTLNYVGCFGVIDKIDSLGVTTVPAGWVAYTEETSPEAIQKLEDLVTSIAATAKLS